MSFYGKVIQDLTNNWRGFLLGNKDKKGETFPRDADVVDGARAIRFDASTTQDEGRIASANRWIQFTTDGEENTCNIYHGPAGGEKQTDVLGITGVGEVVTDKAERQQFIDDNRQLNFGSKISFSNLKYDAAGHIVSNDVTEFVMPEEPEVVTLARDVEALNDTVGLPLYVDDDGEDSQTIPDRKLLRRVERLEQLAEITKLLAQLVSAYQYKEPSYPEETDGAFEPPDISSDGRPPINVPEQGNSIQTEVGLLRSDLGNHETLNYAFPNTDIAEFLSGQNEHGNAISDNGLGISEMRALQNPVNATLPSLIGRLTELNEEISPLSDPGNLGNNISYNGTKKTEGFIVGALNNIYNKVQEQITDLTNKFQGTVDDSTNAASASALAILQIGFDRGYSPDEDTIFSIKHMLDVLKNVLGTEYDFMIKTYGGTSIADRLKAIEKSVTDAQAQLQKSIQALEGTVTTNENDIEDKVTNLTSQLGQETSARTTLGETVSTVQTNLASLTNLVGTRDNDLMSNKTVIETIKQEHDSIQSTNDELTELSTNFDTLKSFVGDDDQKGALATRITALESSSSSQGGNLGTLQSSVESNTQNITSLQGSVSSLNEQYSELNSQISSQGSNITQLQSNYNNVNEILNGGQDMETESNGLVDQVSTALTDISELKTLVGESEASGLQQRIKTLENNYSTLSQQVGGFDTRIAKIEALLTEKYPEDFPGE